MVRVRICVKDDTQDQRLPFGASGSVASFLRISAALVCIGQVCLGFWSCFFNFPTITLASLAAQCKSQVHLLFLICWALILSETEKGRELQAFKALGLLIENLWKSSNVLSLGDLYFKQLEIVRQP